MAIVNYVGTGIKTLTTGNQYHAKIDGAGNFRVRNDMGRWDKYGIDKFTISLDVGGELDDLFGSKEVEISEGVKDKIPTSFLDSFEPSTDFIDKGEDEDEDKLTLKELEKLKEMLSTKVGTERLTDAIAKRAEERKAEVIATKTIKKVEEKSVGKKKVTVRGFLQGQGVSNSLIDDMEAFRKFYNTDDAVRDRVNMPKDLYLGGEVWTTAITALLEGQHLLLQGAKASGKNVLCDNLSFFFGRPQWDISFHVNMDASSLIGADTFKANEVQFRPGAVYNCGLYGGFGILDEVNMAKNEASAVLHSVTDDRRVIDVPGYNRMKLHEATRFIATMNYGYAGTRELNEAFASRFVIIHVPQLNKDGLIKLFQNKFSTADKAVLNYYAGVFEDLQKKAENAEITTKSVDLRGIIAALMMTKRGMSPFKAMEANVVNKCFDQYERDIVKDVVKTRIAESWNSAVVFPTKGSITIDMGGK